uniref:Centriolar coiled-coil protein 110 n=1 Tax=Lates calcarifer TaxID=8187 RepID=A0A4W6CHU5_LATCA
MNTTCVEEESNLLHPNSHTAAPSTMNLTVEGDVTSVLAKSSEHIDQLESNLSSLKVLILDLESTVKENLENRSQTGSNTQNEVSFKGIECSEKSKNNQHMQLPQSDCDHWEDKLRDDDVDSNDTEYMEWPGRQSFNNSKNKNEDTGPEPVFSDADDVPLIMQEKGKEAVNLREIWLVKALATERVKEKGIDKEELMKSYGPHRSFRKQQPSAKCILSTAQQIRIPDIFRNVPSETTVPCNVSVLSDTSNHPAERRNETAVEGHDSTHSPSLNQSYDVDKPSGLWLLEGSGPDLGSNGHLFQEKQLTPESGEEGQGGVSKVKRRLLMHMTEESQERSADTSGGAGCVVRPSSSTPRATVRWYENCGSHKSKQEQLKQAHAAQVRALQDEHRRQQEELLQALAVRYHLLQSVSFPCSMSTLHLGDMPTFSTLSQPSSPLSEHYRPLLSAVVKGFLTRRLLRTERVAQLVRTIRDTQQFLHAFQQQSPGRGEFCSRQDLLLQERVNLQLRTARYEVYDIFFSLSAAERMQLISWDRELVRERELRQQSGHTGHPRRKTSLSAATQKSLERKRGIMIQKKAAERHRGVVTRTGHKTGFSAEQPLETKRGQFRANPQRVPKSTYSTRPR